ncbi:MAG TPA: DUF4190 domain-containing protein [Candidatus Dormibacteraeota bacterium]|nr:DUF4190 domain-containing protein [Candidatus Dormibacteraeota bacterium]
MSTPPSALPGPPPPVQPSVSPTQIAGQQFAPSTTVPHGPAGPTYAPAANRTNTLAIISLVAGIGSFFANIVPGIGGFTVALVAIVTGYMARQQIRESGEQGMGMATAGMVIGIIHLALLGLLILFLIFLIFVLGVTLFGLSRPR